MEEEVDLRCAGTLRFMFSSASRLSAWKSGWRNVQLCYHGGEDSERGGEKEEKEKRTCSPN